MKEKTGLLIIGAYRDFFKNEKNFTDYLIFLQKHKEVVIFAYLSKTSIYQGWHNSKGFTKYKDEIKENEDLFIKILNKLGIKYVLNYYNSNEDFIILESDNIRNKVKYCDKKGIICKDDSFLYQMGLEKRCDYFMKQYEKENRIKFDRVIKTRPDLYYSEMSFSLEILNTSDFVINLDYQYICPRVHFDKLLLKLDYLNFDKYVDNKKSLYKRIYELVKEKKIKYKIFNLWFVNHYFNRVFMDIMEIKNREIWMSQPIRYRIK